MAEALESCNKEEEEEEEEEEDDDEEEIECFSSLRKGGRHVNGRISYHGLAERHKLVPARRHRQFEVCERVRVKRGRICRRGISLVNVVGAYLESE